MREEIGKLRLLSKEDSRQIHQASLRILEEIGMLVMDQHTRRMLRQAGCRESDDGYLHYDEELVHKALSSVPAKMVLYNRNGEVAVDTDDVIPHFSPGLNCVNVLDYRTGEHRICCLNEIVKTAQLCDRLPTIDLAAGLGKPSDVPVSEQAIQTVRALWEGTSKPLAYLPHEEIQDIIRERGLPKLCVNTITDPDKLMAELIKIREHEYAESYEETDQGAWGVATPIRDRSRAVVAGIGVAGPISRFNKERAEQYREYCRNASLQITTLLNKGIEASMS